MAPISLRRRSPGSYETRDGAWTIVHNPAGWVAYRTDEPIAADRYETLGEAREAVAQAQEADRLHGRPSRW